MATVKPFRGLRPAAETAGKVASYPYDVISSDEAREIAGGNPLSFLHVVKPEIDLPVDIDLYDDRVYAKAVENFNDFVRRGVLVQDPCQCYYLYRQIMGDHSQVGLVACAWVEDYLAGKIKRHEFTRRDKEDDRTRHVNDVNANAGPVFLTYRASHEIDARVAVITKRNPDADFTADDGIRHTLWVVSEQEEIEFFTARFGGIDSFYVADGHHRAASAARVGKERRDKNPGHTGDEEYNFFLAVLFPHDQLKILDYNRVVKDLNGLGPDDFLARVREKFEVREERAADPAASESECLDPARTHRFGMILDGKWYSLEPRAGTFDPADPVGSLDVSILQTNLLAPVLGILDPRSDKRIDFIGGIRGRRHLVKVVASGRFKVAFAMHPTSIEELMRIADAGEVMPPKSTWFEPKLRSGLVVHYLESDALSHIGRASGVSCACGGKTCSTGTPVAPKAGPGADHDVLVINPGSTSTKIAVYCGSREIMVRNIDHPSDEIEVFPRIIDQYDYRKKVIIDLLREKDYDPQRLDAVVARGGLLYPLPEGGTYRVTDLMIRHLREAVQGEHASNLGAIIASAVGEALKIPAFIVDPVIVDELMPIARYTGVPEISRKSIWHVLNQKAVAREYAAGQSKRYEDMNLIVTHLGGGISVAAHRRGMAVDVNNALDGEGPFTPTRAGTVPAMQLVKLALAGNREEKDFKDMLSKKGGLLAHLGTHDAKTIDERIEAGDEKAAEVFKAMSYTIAKSITGLIPAFDGEPVDAVILTGGLARDHILVNHVKRMIAPGGLNLVVIPGERELQGLRDGALRVLAGAENPKEYRGRLD